MNMEKLLSEGIKATPPSFVRGILKAASDPDVISFAGGLPEGVSAMSLFPKALEKKVAFVPGDPFYVHGGKQDVNTMRLNFTNADCGTIEEGIRRLGELLSCHLLVE